MNLHVLHPPSLQQDIFRGKEGEVLGVLTYEGIADVVRAVVGKKRWTFKGTFAAIRRGKNGKIFFDDIIKICRLGL